MNLLTSHFNHQLIAAGFPDNELIREAIRGVRSQYGLIARQATLMKKQLIHC